MPCLPVLPPPRPTLSQRLRRHQLLRRSKLEATLPRHLLLLGGLRHRHTSCSPKAMCPSAQLTRCSPPCPHVAAHGHKPAHFGTPIPLPLRPSDATAEIWIGNGAKLSPTLSISPCATTSRSRYTPRGFASSRIWLGSFPSAEHCIGPQRHSRLCKLSQSKTSVVSKLLVLRVFGPTEARHTRPLRARTQPILGSRA